jgi:hypothetical protein
MGRPKRIGYELAPREGNENLYAMLDGLIEKHHEHLTNARIALAWNLTWQPDVDGRCTLGKCKRASDLDRELAPYDFVIMLRHEFFESAEVTDAQRLALIDHELCHAEVALEDGGDEPKVDTKGRTVYRIRKHDLEEFSSVVARHGIWRRDIEDFAAMLERARKTEGKTDEQLLELRNRIVEAGIENEARELLRRVKDGEKGLDVVDDIMARKLAQNPKIRRAIERMRPKEGSVTISVEGPGLPESSVTLHSDGRTE